MNTTFLNDLMVSRMNNLDIIRFIAAVLVIFSHSYPITIGHDKTEPLYLITNTQTGFGHLAIIIFFIISGFLITQSFDRSRDIGYYFRSRVLRIFPALITVVLLTVFVLGPLVTTYSLYDYFTNLETLKYLFLTPSLLFVQYDLPGVFESNPFVGVVNGSLWTLWYEFLFYIVVGCLGYFRLLNKKVISVAFGFCALIILFEPIVQGVMLPFDFFRYAKMFLYFSAGMLVYAFRNEIKLNVWFALLSAIIVVVGTLSGFFTIVIATFGTYIIFYLAYQNKIQFSKFTKYGDFSYGIYIFAFPIQQTVTLYFSSQITPFENFIISTPITLIFAVLSWHFVEKKAMELRRTPLLKWRISVTQNQIPHK